MPKKGVCGSVQKGKGGDVAAVQVICRIRPIQEECISYKIKRSGCAPERIEIYSNQAADSNYKSFEFSSIYDQEYSTEEIMRERVVPVMDWMFKSSRRGVMLLLDRSSLVFSYGITNSGKTYTIIGNQSNPGLLTLTIRHLNRLAEEIASRSRIVLGVEGKAIEKVSYSIQSFELYNEEIYDLLTDKKKQAALRKLVLKETKNKMYSVKDATEEALPPEHTLHEWLDKCLVNRQVAETSCNFNSSRSHTIFKITIHFAYAHFATSATLALVDLAGSERVKKAETQGSQLAEACSINKSLLVLRRCLK